MRIDIEKLVAGGRGMGHIDGRPVFVPLSAPDDALDIEITKDHGDWLEGSIASIITPAKCRRKPLCPVFGECGGCQWQHIEYKEQLKWKRAILIEALERIGKIKAPDVLETMPSPKEWRYRNRIQLHVDLKGRVGFYKPKSKEVVEFDECAIAEDDINAQLKEGRAEFAKRDRGIALRTSGEEQGFAQINTAQSARLKSKLIEWIESVPHDDVLELYAGSGNFTFDIAKLVGRVVASDVDGRVIETARQRQIKGDGGNIEFVRSSGAKAVRRFPEGCDVIVLDPPRVGAADAIEDMAKASPKNIFYISCDPQTLARDAKALSNLGYRPAKALPVDMFPHTHHVEALAHFCV